MGRRVRLATARDPPPGGAPEYMEERKYTPHAKADEDPFEQVGENSPARRQIDRSRHGKRAEDDPFIRSRWNAHQEEV